MPDIKEYILSIVAAALFCTIVKGLLNEKTTIGQIVKMLSGLLMAVAILSPLVNITFNDIYHYFDDLNADAAQYVQDGKDTSRDQICSIIKSQTEAYILDKANRMGLEISVEVELDDSSNPIPCGVVIRGGAAPYAKEVMQAYIEDNLGISKGNQQWM